MTLSGKAVAVALMLFAIGAATVRGFGIRAERQRTIAVVEQLQDRIFRARGASERCQSSVSSREASLLILRATIDSMRAEVDRLETLEEGGVAEARYDGYLEVFHGYNDSVAVYDAREARLREIEASCRETIESHNLLADSLRRVLLEAGIEPTGT